MPSRMRTLAENLVDNAALGEPYIFVYFDESDVHARALAEQCIVEGKTYDLGQGRAVRFDRAHAPNGQDHLHCLLKGQSLYALNRDGTAHDQSHGATMLRCYTDFIQQKYPDWTVPQNRIIEAMLANGERGTRMLVEANESAGRTVLVPPSVMSEAVLKVAWLG